MSKVSLGCSRSFDLINDPSGWVEMCVELRTPRNLPALVTSPDAGFPWRTFPTMHGMWQVPGVGHPAIS